MGAALNQLRDEIHGVAKSKGWWDPQPMMAHMPNGDGLGFEIKTDRTPGDLLMLVVSEASEALEEVRNGKPLTEVYAGAAHRVAPDGPLVYKPEGFPIELADIVIRVLDICGAYKIDIAEAMAVKMQYNRTRPERHGGKLL